MAREHNDDADFDALLRQLYAGITEPKPFNTFLNGLRTAVDADSSTLIIERQRRDRPGGIFSSLATPARLSTYRQFFTRDPFCNLALGRAVTIAEHLGAAEVHRSPFMQAFMLPHGVFHVMGVDLLETSGARVRLRATRLLGCPDFDRREKCRLERLVPHVAQGVGLFLRLASAETERDLFSSAPSRLAVGAILVDRDCQILTATPKAEDILAQGDVLRRERGRLRLCDEAGEAGGFAATVANAAESGSDETPARALCVHRSNGETLGLVIRSAPASARLDAPLKGAAMIILADATSAIAPPPSTLVRMFGLTNAEAELASLLGQGLDLDDASATLGITKNTAKAHLRMVFSKTGVSRQSGLVRLMLRSVDEFLMPA